VSARVERVKALLARAIDDGATVEEQRTSAWIAARLISEHRITIGVEMERVVAFVRPAPASEPEAVVIRAKFVGHCRTCGDSYRVGTAVAWTKGRGSRCLGCHRERRRSA
jgi:hypothetical protein